MSFTWIGRARLGSGSPNQLQFRIPLLGSQRGTRSMSILLPVWCEKVPYDIWDLAAQIEVLPYVNLIPWGTVGCSCLMLIWSPCGYSLKGKKRTWLPNRHPKRVPDRPDSQDSPEGPRRVPGGSPRRSRLHWNAIGSSPRRSRLHGSAIGSSGWGGGGRKEIYLQTPDRPPTRLLCYIIYNI